MLSFILYVVCRYYSDVWSIFIRNDDENESFEIQTTSSAFKSSVLTNKKTTASRSCFSSLSTHPEKLDVTVLSN